MTDAWLMEWNAEGQLVITFMRRRDSERRVYATWDEAAADVMQEMDKWRAEHEPAVTP